MIVEIALTGIIKRTELTMKNATRTLKKDTGIAASAQGVTVGSDAVDVAGDFTGVEPGADAIPAGPAHANDPLIKGKQPYSSRCDGQADTNAEHDPRVVLELTADNFFKLGKFRI